MPADAALTNSRLTREIVARFIALHRMMLMMLVVTARILGFAN
jgi:hypothetical protein